MISRFLILAAALLLPVMAQPQPLGNIIVVSSCGAQAITSTTSAVTYMDQTGKLCVAATVSATATTTATAASTPPSVSAGPNLPLIIDLHSGLFVQPIFAGQPVDGTHGFPVNCIVGCSGGPADESAFTAGTTAIVTGGFFQTTATSNPLTNGQAGTVQMTANRAFFVNLRNASGAELGIAAAPVQVSLANTAANATAVKVDNSAVTQPISVASLPALPANQSVNVSQVNGVTISTGNGTSGAGNQRVNIASDNTAFPVNAQPTSAAAGGATGGTILSAASNNSTSIKASAGTLYSVTVIQTTTTLMDIRFYDTGSAPTCSSATGMKLNFVAQSNATSAGATYNLGPTGVAFTTGIGVCITGANANNDNTNATTGLNLIYAYN